MPNDKHTPDCAQCKFLNDKKPISKSRYHCTLHDSPLPTTMRTFCSGYIDSESGKTVDQLNTNIKPTDLKDDWMYVWLDWSHEHNRALKGIKSKFEHHALAPVAEYGEWTKDGHRDAVNNIYATRRAQWPRFSNLRLRYVVLLVVAIIGIVLLTRDEGVGTATQRTLSTHLIQTFTTDRLIISTPAQWTEADRVLDGLILTNVPRIDNLTRLAPGQMFIATTVEYVPGIGRLRSEVDLEGRISSISAFGVVDNVNFSFEPTVINGVDGVTATGTMTQQGFTFGVYAVGLNFEDVNHIGLVFAMTMDGGQHHIIETVDAIAASLTPRVG